MFPLIRQPRFGRLLMGTVISGIGRYPLPRTICRRLWDFCRRAAARRRLSQTFWDVAPELSYAATLGLAPTGPVTWPLAPRGRRQMVPSPGLCLGLSSEKQWLVQGLMPLLDSLLLGLNSLRPAFQGAVLAPGLARYGGASAGPAKAQLLCLPVAFLCLNPVSLPAVRELAPGLFVSSPALGPFLWGYASSLLGRLLDLWLGLRYLRLGRLLDLRLPGRFGLCLLWLRREVYGVLESMAFAVFRGGT